MLFDCRWLVLFIIAFSVGASSPAYAVPADSGISYQGRILKPDGTPLNGRYVQFIVEIRTPNSARCLMYKETKPFIDMREANGQFAVTVNDGTGTRNDTTGLTLDRIFANAGSFALPVGTCTTGTGAYIPNEGDGRVLAVSFKDETMAVFEDMPAQMINYVPFAFEAKQVQGFTPSQLLRVVEADGSPSATPIAALTNAQYSSLFTLATTGIPSNAVSSSNIVNGTIVGADLSSSIAISTSGAIATTGSVTSNTTITNSVQILPSSGSGGITFTAPVGVGTYSMTYPAAQGGAGQVMVNDGSGNLSWTYLGATYESPGTTGTNGLWFRMATATVTAQYGHAEALINFQSTGTYDLNPANGRIHFRLKMQDPIGGYYAGSVEVDGSSTALQPSDVRGVITSNAGAATTFELWVRLQNNWSSLRYRPTDVFQSNGSMTFTPSALQASPPVGIYTSPGRSGLSPWFRSGAPNENAMGAQRNISYTEGNVGIGTTSPTSKLQVAGTMVSTASTVSSGATVDLAASNTTVLENVGGSTIALSNLTHGGNYTIVVTDPTSRTYDFTGCSGKKWLPANATTIASSWTTYTLLALDDGSGGYNCMITWATGYQ